MWNIWCEKLVSLTSKGLIGVWLLEEDKSVADRMHQLGYKYFFSEKKEPNKIEMTAFSKEDIRKFFTLFYIHGCEPKTLESFASSFAKRPPNETYAMFLDFQTSGELKDI